MYESKAFALDQTTNNELNKVIVKAVDTAIGELEPLKQDVLESKYHSLYILAGIIFSRYDIDVSSLTVKETEIYQEICDLCLDIEQHIEDKWFVDENRQVGFFNKKISRLLELKETGVGHSKKEGQQTDNRILQIRVEGKLIKGNTVKEFYRKVFAYLIDQVDWSDSIPYATGKKRYLINWSEHHIDGELFFVPIKVGEYHIETHKSKMTALKERDMK